MEKDRNGGLCVFDGAFKRITVDLSYAKASVHEATRELGIDSIASANRSHFQMAADSLKFYSDDHSFQCIDSRAAIDQTTRRLKRELKEVEFERIH